MNERIEGIINDAKKGANGVKQYVLALKALKDCESELKDLFYQLGEEAYKTVTSEAEDMTNFDYLVAQISEKKEELKVKKLQFNELNGRIVCNKCGEVTSDKFEFCPYCGNKISIEDCEKCEEKEEV